MTLFLKILFLILSYILGSIPFGLLFSKAKGIDLSKVGSGNIGAANTGRALGKKYAFLTFSLDMLKGTIFVILFRYNIISKEYMILSPALYGLVAMIGHSYSVFLKFRGGKAVATGAGFIFAYIPLTIIVGSLAFLTVFLSTRIASISSLVATLLVCITAIIFNIVGVDILTGIEIDPYFFIYAILAFTLIYLKHIPNIKRLLKKEENKI